MMGRTAAPERKDLSCLFRKMVVVDSLVQEGKEGKSECVPLRFFSIEGRIVRLDHGSLLA